MDASVKNSLAFSNCSNVTKQARFEPRPAGCSLGVCHSAGRGNELSAASFLARVKYLNAEATKEWLQSCDLALKIITQVPIEKL